MLKLRSCRYAMESQRFLCNQIAELSLCDGITEVPMRSNCSDLAARWNRRGAYAIKLLSCSCGMESQRYLCEIIAVLSLCDVIAEVPM